MSYRAMYKNIIEWTRTRPSGTWNRQYEIMKLAIYDSKKKLQRPEQKHNESGSGSDRDSGSSGDSSGSSRSIGGPMFDHISSARDNETTKRKQCSASLLA